MISHTHFLFNLKIYSQFYFQSNSQSSLNLVSVLYPNQKTILVQLQCQLQSILLVSVLVCSSQSVCYRIRSTFSCSVRQSVSSSFSYYVIAEICSRVNINLILSVSSRDCSCPSANSISSRESVQYGEFNVGFSVSSSSI